MRGITHFLRQSLPHWGKARCLRQIMVSSTKNFSKFTRIEDMEAMRKPYKGEGETFDVENLASRDPFAQFTHWFNLACQTDGIIEANAMSLATANKAGRPSCRTVLMKGYDERGFRFYTNYDGRKGRELAENPYACLNFYWEPLFRSVRIEGKVEKLSAEESTKYFHSRPKASQIGACVSDQSSVITSRQVLIDKNNELHEKYSGDAQVEKPENWGGYLLTPEVFEFWQGQTTRLHDRLVFRRPEPSEKLDPTVTHQGENGWVFERLAP